MSKTAITSPELTPPVGPFSQAVEVGGFLYFSGQVGQDPATGKVVAGGIVAETERVFRNLAAVLKAAGRSFDHVARASVYLCSLQGCAREEMGRLWLYRYTLFDPQGTRHAGTGQ